MAFTVTEEPTFLQSSGNPMFLKVINTPYTIGQLFFCEIWVVPNRHVLNTGTPRTGSTLIRTHKLNGKGDGTCVFDISLALQTQFQLYFVPDEFSTFQKDESCYCGYYLKSGFITYNSMNQEVKNYNYDSGEIKWCIRAALPFAVSGDMEDYVYKFDAEPVGYLTNIPQRVERKLDEPTLLSFFLPTNTAVGAGAAFLTVYADLTFAEAAPENNFTLSSHPITKFGGVYIINVRPNRIAGHINYNELVSYTIRVAYEDDLNNQTDMTLSHTFLVADELVNPVLVSFMNRKGTWDMMHFRSNTETTYKTKNNSFFNAYGQRIYNVDMNPSITYHSSYLTPTEYIWLIDMKGSPVVYVNQSYVRQLDTEPFKIDSTVGLSFYDLVVSPDFDENTIKL